MKKLCIVCALFLNACGGGGGSDPVAGGDSGAIGDNGSTAMPAPNAYVTRIGSLIAAGTDGDEAIDVDTVALAAPDDTEPLALN